MLSVYTRHAQNCDHREDINWRRCRCPKWIQGVSPDGRGPIRETAKTRSWEQAEAKVRRMEQAADPTKPQIKPAITIACNSSNGVMSLAAKAAGAAGNAISLGVSAQTSSPQSNQSAFSSSSTSGSLSGGGATIYDSATTMITVSGRGHATKWSGSGTTPGSIASSLAAVINSDPYAYVSASASGGAVSLTSKIIGLGGNLSLSCSSGYDSANFTAPSFTTSCFSALSGGKEAGGLSTPMLSLYRYNALGNVIQVTQQGGTTDRFTVQAVNWNM